MSLQERFQVILRKRDHAVNGRDYAVNGLALRDEGLIDLCAISSGVVRWRAIGSALWPVQQLD
jgi:hypothetical protein